MRLVKAPQLLVLIFWCLIYQNPLRASLVYSLDVFTFNGGYCDSSDLNLYVEVMDRSSMIDFIFKNESLVDSCIARIYFEDDSLLGSADIVNSPGTSFDRLAKPSNLPAGQTLEPPFMAREGFSIDSDAPLPKNGINPQEQLQVTFELANSGTFENIIDALNTGTLRIGVHVIALPDGSSESAIAIPEPGSLTLLVAVGVWVLTRRKRSGRLIAGAETGYFSKPPVIDVGVH